MSCRCSLVHRAVVAACLMLLAVAMLAGNALAGENIARLGAATASSYFATAYLPRYSNDGDLNTRWSASGGDVDLWYQIEWNTPQTFNSATVTYFSGHHVETQLTVQAWNAAASEWVTMATVGDGVNVLPMVTQVDFPTVTTTKVRISKVVTFNELEIYNDTVRGKVLMQGTSKPVIGALVSAGGDSSVTDGAGNYHLSLPPGTYPATVSRNYQYLETSLTVNEGSITTQDIQLASYNLAPLGTASAQTFYPGYGPENGNDDNRSTRYSKNAGEPNGWYEVAWPSEQTFDTVIIRFFAGWHTETLVNVEVWDGADWVNVATVGDPDGYELLPLTTTIQFPPQTSSKVRISNLETFNEMEVYNGVATVYGNVSDSGMPVGCANIQGGFDAVVTMPDGYYSFMAPVGNLTIRTVTPAYDDAKLPFTLTTDGFYQDIALTRTAGNLALEAGVTVTASSSEVDITPEMAADGFACTLWEVPEETVDGWYVLEWPSPKTVDTVIVKGGGFGQYSSVDVWKDGSWMQVGVGAGQFSFAPIETTKLRLRHIVSAPEIEVYNLKGAAAQPTIQGVVTSSKTGAPLAGAVVTVGNVSAITGESGQFYLAAPTGNQTIEISHMTYDTLSQSIYIPTTGSMTQNFSLTTQNIAPEATATASTEYPEFPASSANDENPLTRWSATDRVSTFELTWPQAVTINRVKVHQVCDPYGGWGINSLKVEYWDGAKWVTGGSVSGLNPPVPATVDLPIAISTTTKIKLTGTISIAEVEVYKASDITTGTIPEIRNLPDGSSVQISGAITATFVDIDAGYLEAADRSSGIRVEPLEKLGRIVEMGPNLCLTGTASAESTYPGYGPELSIDGNMETRWSATANYQWFQIDWTEPQTFNSVTIYNLNESFAFHDVEIKVLNEASGVYETVAFGFLGISKVFSFPSVTTRSLHITGLTTVYEIEARTLTVDDTGLMLNRDVTLTGTLTTRGKERVLLIGQSLPGGVNVLEPVAMCGKSFSTEQGQLSTIGLLTTTWGRVKAKSLAGEGLSYLYVDDGSNLPTDIAGVTGVKVGPVDTDILPGQFVSVTGIAGAFDHNDIPVRTLRPRASSEVIKHSVVGPNLAPLGIVTAESTFQGDPVTYAPEKLIDGSLYTRWSANANYQWVQLDWSTPQTFNAVFLICNDTKQYNYATVGLQVWNEGTQMFEDLATQPGFQDIVALTFPTITAQRIRVTGVTTFYELEVRNIE